MTVTSHAQAGASLAIKRFFEDMAGARHRYRSATIRPHLDARDEGADPRPRSARRGVGDAGGRHEPGHRQHDTAERGVGVSLRQQVGRAHEEEEARVHGKQVPEVARVHRRNRADDGAEQWGDCVECEPTHRASHFAALAQDERHRVHPVGEIVRDHRDEHEQAGSRVQVKGERDAEPVDEAVHGEPRRAEDADVRVCLRVLGVVTVMQDERALRQEEREEAGADEPGHLPARADGIDRLREHVEERDRDDDAACESDQRRQVLAHPQRRKATEQRRARRQAREWDCDPGDRRHAQRSQRPKMST